MDCTICCNSLSINPHLEGAKVFREFCEIFSIELEKYNNDLIPEFCIQCTAKLTHFSQLLRQLKVLQEEIESFKAHVKSQLIKNHIESEKSPSSNSFNSRIFVNHNLENQNVIFRICNDLGLFMSDKNVLNCIYEDEECNVADYVESIIDNELNFNIKQEKEIFYDNDTESTDAFLLLQGNIGMKVENENPIDFDLLKAKALKNDFQLKIKRVEDMSQTELLRLSNPTCKRRRKVIHKSYQSKSKSNQNDGEKMENEKSKKKRPADRQTCRACDEKFLNSQLLQDHWKDAHNNEIIPCKNCGKMFKNGTDLSKHFWRVHAKTICNVCGKEVRKEHLNIHVKSHAERSVTCNICGKILKNEKILASHHNNMHNKAIEKPTFVCKYCGKVYVSPHGLMNHEKQIHEKEFRFVCSICPKGYQTKESLKDHMRSHGEFALKCSEPGCGKEFSSRSSKTRHKLEHSGEKPHKCKICGKAFGSGYQLNVHLTIHTPHITPVSCTKCGRKFTHKNFLNKHNAWHAKVEAMGRIPKYRPSRKKNPSTIIIHPDESVENSKVQE